MSPRSNLHTAWATWFVSALADAGVVDVVVSPGSRSTPLTLAFAAEPRVRCHTLVDERAAGFFALGQARATGRPSVLVCTSGTAGAHYHPAVLEAHQSYTPLFVLTADRPWEAYDCAAPQTVDQTDLFGSALRHRAELGLPDADPTALRAVARVAAQSVAMSLRPTPGPVHVNARFRKPLEPVAVDGDEPWSAELAAMRARGATRVFAARDEPDPVGLRALSDALRGAARPVLVAGPSVAQHETLTALRALSSRARCPLLVESASGIRFAGDPDAQCVGAMDSLLRSREFRARHAPDLFVEFGLPSTSSWYGAWLDAHDAAPRWIVSPWGWPDPRGGATAIVRGEVARIAAALGDASAPSRSAWCDAFAKSESLAWRAVDARCDGDAWVEGVVARAVVDALPAGASLVAGNSMAVRDLDTYCAPRSSGVRVFHQRGASGIDGLVAGAAGLRSVSDCPVVLLVGDVSFAHDLGGLSAARGAGGPLVIVVVDNGGGRIFDLLPMGQTSRRDPALRAAFERHFLTPQDVSIAHAAAAFSLDHARVTDRHALRDAMARGLSSTKPLVIEAVVDGDAGLRHRESVHRAVADALARGGLTP